MVARFIRRTITLAAPNGQVRSFKIVGIFRTGRAGYDETQTFITLKRAQALLGRTDRANSIIIKLDDPYDARRVAADLEARIGYKALSWQEASEDLLGTLVVRSKVGLILRAIREDAMRVRYFGYDVARYETFVFALSAAIAGWAGMLYALVLEFASPTYIGVAFSLAIVIWVAVGGRESLVGAAVGAILVNMAEGRLSDMFVESWLLMLGVMFILFVLFLPRGLFGAVDAAARWLLARRSSGEAARKRPVRDGAAREAVR